MTSGVAPYRLAARMALTLAALVGVAATVYAAGP